MLCGKVLVEEETWKQDWRPRVYKANFCTMSSATCANHALHQAGMDKKEGHPMAAKAIERNFCMKDIAKSAATVEETIQFYKDVGTNLKLGGFNLMKRICNSEWFTWGNWDEDQSDAKNKSFEVEPHFSSLLGMQLNVDSDTLEVCYGAG